jgi:CHAT domain-containing protein
MESLAQENENDWKLSADKLEQARRSRAERETLARKDLEVALSRVGRSNSTARVEPLDCAPGEVVIAYHQGRGQWLGVATDGERWMAQRLGTLAAGSAIDDLSRHLLEPFRPLLTRAKRLRVMPTGLLRTIDFHGLVWDGAPLVERMTVVYSLDQQRSAPQPSSHRALLVSDPAGDLDGAKDESHRLATALRQTGRWQVRVLDGLQTNGPRLLDALGDADFFHYAGHGKFGADEGWGSALLLSEGASITVADLLVMPRAPAQVVLFACEGARSPEHQVVEGLGIAQAFVLAGSREVVAPTRPIDDRFAAEFGRQLAAAFANDAMQDLATALRSVQAAYARADSTEDWTAFRALAR